MKASLSFISHLCHLRLYEFDQEILLQLHVADEGCDGTESNGVLASELNQKLSHLLIERQENQIAELESELHLAQSKLHEKEGELRALKDSVRRLTQLSLSAISGIISFSSLCSYLFNTYHYSSKLC